MTLCFSTSAVDSPFALICSDVVVTEGDESNLHKAPTRVLKYDQENSSFQLARKNYISKDGRTAIAFAGSVETIVDFLDYVEFTIDDLSSPRPLRRLAERATHYTDGDISVLAISAASQSNQLQVHRVCQERYQCENKALGIVASIGSGRGAVEEAISGKMHFGQDQRQNALTLYFHLLSDKLISEIYGLKTIDFSWGGFLELLQFDFDEGKWRRQPRLAVFVHQFDVKRYDEPRLVDRMFFYDPGTTVGWLHAIRSNSEYAHNISCSIRPLLENNSEAVPPNWLNWAPEQILLISVNGVENDQTFDILETEFQILPVDASNGVASSVGSTGMRLRPQGEKYAAFLSRQVAKRDSGWT